MNRKRRPLLVLTLPIACAGAAVGTAFAFGSNTASAPLARNDEGVSLQELPDPRNEPTPKGDEVVCPGILFKVGLRIELPCGHGAEIVKADFVEVDGRYCAKVTYIPERGAPSRTETLCERGMPSVGGSPLPEE
jgi:hypothetical protein